MERQIILKAIGYTEPSTFNEFCSALGTEMPSHKEDWRSLFQTLESLEKDGFVEVERTNGKIDSLQLTEDGANIIRS